MSIVKGTIAEKYTEYFFLKHGYSVSTPQLRDSPFDLLISNPEDFNKTLKIQVKSAFYVKDKSSGSCWKVKLYKGSSTKQPYTIDEVDYFAIFIDELEVLYVIPFEDCGNSIALYPDPRNETKYCKYKFNTELKWRE